MPRAASRPYVERAGFSVFPLSHGGSALESIKDEAGIPVSGETGARNEPTCSIPGNALAVEPCGSSLPEGLYGLNGLYWLVGPYGDCDGCTVRSGLCPSAPLRSQSGRADSSNKWFAPRLPEPTGEGGICGRATGG